MKGSRVSDYEYVLPPELIARYPAPVRDESRLLVVPRDGSPLRHLVFRRLVDLFEPGDVLVVNDSRVIPARLLGRKPTGAPSEILLLRPTADADPVDPRTWEALVRPGGKLKPGRRVVVADDLEVVILESAASQRGGRVVRLESPGPASEAIERHGHVPLPPYLDREDEPVDRERYQTVYARFPGSVAAPTAGLHFTPELLAELEARGVRRVAVTLEVGVGTFRPVEADDPAVHEMHPETWRVEPATAQAINQARQAGRRCWAVGTTVARTLETAAREDGSVQPGAGATRLFVRPPYRFRAVDALLTNFHLPRSTLLMLVSAFGGYERVMDAYRTAVAERYRFYSYGDAMTLV